MEHYSAIKNNEIMSFAGKMKGNGDHHVVQDKPNSKSQISNVFTGI
jgi:hypothetical protein